MLKALLLVISIIALQIGLGPLVDADMPSVKGTWVGGIDVGDDYIPVILRVQGADGELSATIDLLDRVQDPLTAPRVTLQDAELRVALNDSTENPQYLALTLADDALDGAFVIGAGDDARRYPMQLVSMATIEPEALDAREGVFRVSNEQAIRITNSDRGFLIAHFTGEHRFQYLFPAVEDHDFFAGQTFERAAPRSIDVEFTDDDASIHWREGGDRWTAHRFEPEELVFELDVSAEATRIISPSAELALVRIEPGSFEMGQQHTDKELGEIFGVEDVPEREVDPVRPTTISRPFFMATTELTSAWFDLFVRETSYLTDAERKGYALAWNGEGFDRAFGASWKRPGIETTADTPAIMVSWNDAMAICGWLSEKLGRTVRLPTEAEWEYACRAGTTTMFSFGGEPDETADHAWCDANAEGPMPVGQKPASPWGLHDMHGNAWEWCADVFAPISGEPATDPTGPEGDGDRVLRGGSWINGPWSQRCAYRAGEEVTLAEPHIGFRVVVEGE